MYVCGVAVAEGPVGGASLIDMVEDRRAVGGKEKENISRSLGTCHQLLSSSDRS